MILTHYLSIIYLPTAIVACRVDGAGKEKDLGKLTGIITKRPKRTSDESITFPTSITLRG